MAKKHPAMTNSKLAEDALRAHGAQRLAADHGKAGQTINSAPAIPPRRQRLLQHQAGQVMSPPSAAQDGWMIPPWPSGTNT